MPRPAAALLAGAELGLLSVRKTRLKELLEQGSKSAKAVSALRDDPALARIETPVLMLVALADRLVDARAAARVAQEPAATPRPSTPGKVPPRVASATPAPKVGGLGWPASGDLLARYGGRLPDGRTSVA